MIMKPACSSAGIQSFGASQCHHRLVGLGASFGTMVCERGGYVAEFGRPPCWEIRGLTATCFCLCCFLLGFSSTGASIPKCWNAGIVFFVRASACPAAGIVFLVRASKFWSVGSIFFVRVSACPSAGIVLLVRASKCWSAGIVVFVRASACPAAGIVLLVRASKCWSAGIVLFVRASACLAAGIVFPVQASKCWSAGIVRDTFCLLFVMRAPTPRLGYILI